MTLPENNNQIFASKYQTVTKQRRITTSFKWRIKLQIGLDGDILWEAMSGAILLSMITGFACTINAIEKNKKKYPPIFLQEFIQRN